MELYISNMVILWNWNARTSICLKIFLWPDALMEDLLFPDVSICISSLVCVLTIHKIYLQQQIITIFSSSHKVLTNISMITVGKPNKVLALTLFVRLFLQKNTPLVWHSYNNQVKFKISGVCL